MGLVAFGLFYLFFATGWVFEHGLAGALLLASRSVFMVIMLFLMVIYLRRRGLRSTFLAVMSHAVLMCTAAAAVQTLPEYLFYEAYPSYKKDVYMVSRNRFLKEYVDGVEDKTVRERALNEIKAQDERMQQVISQPNSLGGVFQSLLYSYLFMGLLFGAILGGLFHYLS